jgi:F-type H+-transporting ATPase subunit alpha
VEKIKNYEPQLLSFVKGKYPEILKEIDEKQIIGPELDKKLREVLAAFDSVFVTE